MGEAETAALPPTKARVVLAGMLNLQYERGRLSKVTEADVAVLLAWADAATEAVREPALLEHEGRDAEVSGLDVLRLAAALHGWKQCDFGYCEGSEDHVHDARDLALEYARLASTDKPDPAS